ncbi:MAG: transglutaminase-like domain-containing protein, partial [Pseudomonadota bacterium]
IDRWRIDGMEVIRQFEADESTGKRARYDAPAVMVLDRTVVVLTASGASLTLTHNIIKVLAKDALQQWGEIRVPDGSEQLIARAIKADYSTREPEALAKEGLTIPDLAVGDYVESEFIVAEPPSTVFRDGFFGSRFYFGTFDLPLDRSELVVVAPKDFSLDWDVRGDSPTPTIAAVPGDDTLAVTVFFTRSRAQLMPEPGGPPPAEYVASVLPYARVDIDSFRRWIGAQSYGARRANRAVRSLAQSLTALARTPLDRVRAIHRQVTSKIEGWGPLSTEPSQILAMGRGNRVILMMAMCEAVGIPVELWLARSRAEGEGEPTMPDIADYSTPLIRILLPGLENNGFLDLRSRYAPFGYLGPDVRGAFAMLVPNPEGSEQRPALAQIPQSWDSRDERTVDIQVTLAADGSAEIGVREVVGEHAAVPWRDQLEDAQVDALGHHLEQQVLGSYFPGVSLRSLAFDGRERADGPLVIRYRFSVPRYARVRADGVLDVPAVPMPLQMARRYVMIGTRTTPLILQESARRTRTSVSVELPSGYRLGDDSTAPVDIVAPASAGAFHLGISVRPRGFDTQTDSLLELFSRIPAAEYQAFVRFAAAVDAAEARTLPLRPPWSH